MNGIIVIDKENGYTSFDVVAKMRRICGEKKIGHTGTLDPMATGVLPILIGNATKAQSLLPESDKEYEATLSFGITTDTLDITGKVLSQTESNVKSEDLEAVLPQFRGDIMQLPPMYSAVSKDGVRLYELARKGLVTEREARPITVYKLDLLNFDEQLQSAQILVKCSKGTYIRSICDDIGQVLGCGAVMTSLRRVTACGYTLDDAITLEKAKELSENGMLEEYLRPTESVFACYPSVKVTEAQAVRFKNGGGLMLSRTDVDDSSENGAYYRVYNSSDVFLGLGYVNKEKEELSVKKQF
ncbi:tRNA pseudouridine(55) synthase TruB [Pseudoruminococcus massiliensis]|uniref:tRNA pseudouridine(55) synthase TruB n=1 Tax=Pseudoruminococcus massiliensis TaxID=2086583 RepID=UPI0022DE9B0C|nr:tRNA pseudouridine(55) synthase TruB [Pseudoruminococcus massiliensis]